MKRRVGIIYSAISKMPRRLVVYGPGETFNLDAHIGNGEAGMVYEYDEAGKPDAYKLHPERLRQIVADHHRMPVGNIPDGRCAIVCPKTKLVLNTVMADPEIDAHPEGKVLALPEGIGINDKHDGKDFLKRFVVSFKGKKVEYVIWDREEPVELAGYLYRSSMLDVGDPALGTPVFEAPSEGTKKL